MSDREQSGLRGRVKSCVEETTYPGFTDSDGKRYPERKAWSTTEYEIDGRVMARRSRNSTGSGWVTRYTYGDSGRQLKVTSGKEGDRPSEMVYVYDDDGRLVRMTSSQAPDNPVTYRYDEHGRKTQVAVSRAADYRGNVAVAGSPFQVAVAALDLPGGGTATTIYDEHDRPTEVQVRNAQGEVVNRALRIYDAQGRIVEEKQILDNPETIIPAEARAKILEESGASAQELREELRAQLSKLLGGKAEPYSMSYSYDTQGRIKETRRKMFNEQEVIETEYNEHGDKAVEITRGKTIPTKDDPSPGAAITPYSEVRYSYVYDSYGNWTEQAVSFRSTPDGTFETSNVLKRTLTYY